MRWLLSPLTPPFFGFLEMEQGWKKETMEIPIASLSAEQWLRWDLDEGDGRGRDQITNIHSIIEKAREFQRNI